MYFAVAVLHHRFKTITIASLRFCLLIMVMPIANVILLEDYRDVTNQCEHGSVASPFMMISRSLFAKGTERSLIPIGATSMLSMLVRFSLSLRFRPIGIRKTQIGFSF